jgi:hypothetical protein
LHVSIQAGKKDLKGNNRAISAHVYPSGIVSFSKKQYSEVRVNLEDGSAGSAIIDSVWNEEAKRFGYWTGTE